MFAVGTCYQLSLLLLTLIILPTVTEARRVRVDEEVTGYLNHDVTLPCWFITESSNNSVTQMQWKWKLIGEEKEESIVFNPQFGSSDRDSPLKERMVLANSSKDDFSLIIKDVIMTDKGEFTCTLTTFPAGTLEGTVRLTVQESPPSESPPSESPPSKSPPSESPPSESPPSLPTGIVIGIVMAVILLLIVMAAIAYLVIRMRHSQNVSAGRPTVEVSRTSKVLREEDLVYMDTKACFASRRIDADADDDEHKPETPQDDDEVIYSQVRVGHQHPE